MKPSRVFRPALLLVIAVLVSQLAVAQEKVLTPELILTIRNITDAQVSPDGASIIFQVSRPRRDDEKPGCRDKRALDDAGARRRARAVYV